MPLTYSRFAILILLSNIIFGNGAPNSTSDSPTDVAKAISDPKRRNDLVDEAFMEQKDILLDMLEAKLKEVRDKKNRRVGRTENTAVGEFNKCELLPDDVDLKLQASGIVAVGETDVLLRFGDSGNKTLNMNASGISNVGKTNLKLEIGDGTVNIPGLQNLLSGSSFLRALCENRNAADPKLEPSQPPELPKIVDISNDDRRSKGSSNKTNSTPTSVNSVNNSTSITSDNKSPTTVVSVQNEIRQGVPEANVQNAIPILNRL
ncbi:uncharacterized protein LOC123872042 [Maniola jurtina]|uniref:uncharacterized protein LOC123872042 n=1 Tax=Maniola jurtina TaxID=191418 RepID=UPI001E68971A|nr:uncharacterized protein LOC123872042 [Maniola jurtina]